MLAGNKSNQGFTLLELIITLAVVATLMLLTAPTVGQILGVAQRNRDVNELRVELISARSEAIRRSSNVAICASDDLISCGDSWSLGWIVYVDDNRDGSVTEGEAVIRRHRRSQSGITMTASVTHVTFVGRGGTSDTGGIRFTSAQENIDERLIRIDSVGQPRVCEPQADAMECRE